MRPAKVGLAACPDATSGGAFSCHEGAKRNQPEHRAEFLSSVNALRRDWYRESRTAARGLVAAYHFMNMKVAEVIGPNHNGGFCRHGRTG